MKAEYADTGCEFAPSCLACSFAQCVFEGLHTGLKVGKRERDAKLVKLYTENGKTLDELAQMFEVHKRTIQRSLKGVL